VLVKVAACGVCGTDVLLYSGRIARSYPYNPGHECVGMVAAAGEQVAHVEVGDRVAVDPNHGCGTCPFCVREMPHLCENLNAPGVKSNGGFAEYCTVPAKLVHRLPDSLSLEAAVLAEPLSCALHTIEIGGELRGQNLVIVGCGCMGLLLVALARRAECTLIVASEPVPWKRELAGELGAHLTLDPFECDVSAEVMRVTGSGADIAIEASGSPEACQQTVEIVRKGGTVVLCGLAGDEARVSLSPQQIVRDELCIRGSVLNPFSFARAVELLAEGLVDPSQFLTHRFRLCELERAFEVCERGEALKALILSEEHSE